jgi:DNA-binding LacI/PurR family transcriptional regulator
VDRAIGLLIRQIDTRTVLTETVVLQPELTVRQSTARCAKGGGDE